MIGSGMYVQTPHFFFGLAHRHFPPGAVCSPQRVRMLGLPFAFWTATHRSTPRAVCSPQRVRMLGLPFAFWTATHRSTPRGPAAVHRWFFFLPVEKQLAFFLQALGFSGVHSVSTMVGGCADARLSRQSTARVPSRAARTARRVLVRAIPPPPPPPLPPSSRSSNDL